jgi:AraC-like DNA-binding protein
MVRTLEYMSACAKSDFNLAQLCRTIGLSSSLFIQLFKRSSDGLSPAAYFNRLVMAKARRLLRTTDWPVKNVAYELGFQNDSHFCRVFHASFGMSPGAFRESTVREMVCAPQPEPPIPPGPCAQRLVVRDDRRLTALAKMGSSRDTSTLAAAILKGPVMPSANAGRLVAARRHSLELIAGGNRP